MHGLKQLIVYIKAVCADFFIWQASQCRVSKNASKHSTEISLRISSVEIKNVSNKSTKGALSLYKY